MRLLLLISVCILNSYISRAQNGLIPVFPKEDKVVNVCEYKNVMTGIKKYDYQLTFNDEFFKTISDAERAALAYVATFWGNGCGDITNGNLLCGLTNKLQLGYQCNNRHKAFMSHWFSGNPKIIEKIKTECYKIPFTATYQSSINKLKLYVLGKTIKVVFESSFTGQAGNKINTYANEIVFQISGYTLKLVSEKSTKIKTE